MVLSVNSHAVIAKFTVHWFLQASSFLCVTSVLYGVVARFNSVLNVAWLH